ncbi:unnamed protein product [Bursaphelenchus okinawaensis]|uniref:FERM domain-containing protein 8 n=1 Tax=Bursaphelenchus okinawaensis TaxID=465554 RepID=A0A811LFF6_9BILA|nr:unnamed protein product [Bursaphelenchus okinawaensis]CAG9121442.1 unnamed protein product [Bursaphelenchus okinawaensis]
MSIEENDTTLTADSSGAATELKYVQRPTSIPIPMHSLNNNYTKRRSYQAPYTSSPIGGILNEETVVPLSHVQSDSFSLAEPAKKNFRLFSFDGDSKEYCVPNVFNATAEEILLIVASDSPIDVDVTQEALALWLISSSLEIQIKPQYAVYAMIQKWPSYLRRFTTCSEEEILFDVPNVYIRRNVHLTPGFERRYTENEELTEILYDDAKDEYLSGRYIVTLEDSKKLAGYMMAIDQGFYTNDQKALDYLSDNLSLYVPEYLLNKCKTFMLFGWMECRKGCEKEILHYYKEALEKSSNYERRKEFLEVCRDSPCYGATFFYGATDRMPPNSIFGATKRLFSQNPMVHLRIGVNYEYITIADEKTNELLLTRRVADCTYFSSNESNIDEEIPEFFLNFPDDSVLLKAEELETSINSDQSSAMSLADDLYTKLMVTYTKQARLICSLMKEVDRRQSSGYGSEEDDTISFIETPESQLTSDDTISLHPQTQQTLSTRSIRSCSRNSITNKSDVSSISNASRYSKSNLSKVCTATQDPQGRWIEAHGTVARFIQECN